MTIDVDQYTTTDSGILCDSAHLPVLGQIVQYDLIPDKYYEIIKVLAEISIAEKTPMGVESDITVMVHLLLLNDEGEDAGESPISVLLTQITSA